MGLGGGTTSAHAENTLEIQRLLLLAWNYLRARGEYTMANTIKDALEELPPRTRRIPGFAQGFLNFLGTTSAHAENTGRVNHG